MTSKSYPLALRQAFGCFMTGVTVVTTSGPMGRPLGFTANSFTSVSLDPPLLLVSISNASANLEHFARGRGFAVSVLAEHQRDISACFAHPSDDRFAQVHWTSGPIGSPLIDGAAAWFDCSLEQALPAGDHTLLLGRIGAFETTLAPALGYYRGAYLRPASTAAHMPAGPDVVISAVVEAEGQVLLVDDGRGGISVPMVRVGREGLKKALDSLLAELGIAAEKGSIYAVYEDSNLGTQHIVLRCPARPGKPRFGAFVDLTPNGMSDVSDPALRSMLQRLAEESSLGNYGIYFGTHERGLVQSVVERPTK